MAADDVLFPDSIKNKVAFFESQDPNCTMIYSDAEIITLSSAYKPYLAFKFKNVFPVSLGAISFDSTLTDTEPVVVDVTFKYTTYEVQNLNMPGQ